MKTLLKKLTLLIAAVAFVVPMTAQSYLEDPKWGATPEDREKNALDFNFLRDLYNGKEYDQAIPYIQSLIEKAPKSSANIYVYGVNIYKNKIARATSVAEKNTFIDSMLMLYELRAEHFGDAATNGAPVILKNMAIDYQTYKPQDREGLYDVFNRAIEAMGNDLDASFVNLYFNELTNDFKNDEIEADFYINEYEKLEALMLADSDPANDEARSTFDALFITSGAANCENLNNIFGKKFADNPDDADMLTKAVGLMMRRQCAGELFLSMAEKLHSIEPSSATALALAAAYEDRKEYDRSVKYLEDALAIETDPEQKVNLYIRMASSMLGSNNARSAADYARQALAINPDSGLAYYVMAQAYAAAANGCSGFNRQVAYWLIYDTLSRAKSMLGSEAAQFPGIDSQLGTYRANFPSSEDCFFRNLNEGEGYTVSCGWLSGRTTVRVGR